jgi:hypothetical protein
MEHADSGSDRPPAYVGWRYASERGFVFQRVQNRIMLRADARIGMAKQFGLCARTAPAL